MTIPRLAAATLAMFALAACATPGTRPLSGPPPTESGTTAASAAVVPDVTGVKADSARRLVIGAKLVPVIRYAPEILVNAGSVMLSMPKAGASAATGDVVVLVVAGKPDRVSDGRTPGVTALTDLAAARDEIFVGVGFAGNDMHKPLVVALAPGVDPSIWQDRLVTAAGTQEFTVRVCDHTRAALLQIRAEVTGDGPHKIPMAVSIRPAECAVHVIGNLPADEQAALKERYGTAVVIEAGR